MPGKHKNPTISFRVSDYERRAIEANIKMSGMLKKDYFYGAAFITGYVWWAKRRLFILW